MRMMMKWGAFAVLVGCLSGGVAATATAEMTKWNLDKDHTSLGFEVVHMVVSKT